MARVMSAVASTLAGCAVSQARADGVGPTQRRHHLTHIRRALFVTSATRVPLFQQQRVDLLPTHSRLGRRYCRPYPGSPGHRSLVIAPSAASARPTSGFARPASSARTAVPPAVATACSSALRRLTVPAVRCGRSAATSGQAVRSASCVHFGLSRDSARGRRIQSERRRPGAMVT